MANLKEHGLIVSCQAVKGEPLYGLHIMGHFARAAVLGGAAGIRANYVEDINEITAEVDVPVIGIIKAEYPDSEVYITPTLKEVKALLTTKCSVIALDATKRSRPNGEKIEDLIKYIRENAPEVEIMADCSNYEEAKRADELGFDYIGTTLLAHPDASQEELHVRQWTPYELKDEPDATTALTAILEYMQRNQLDALHTSTQIIIAPGYTYKIVNRIITNFHQPQSTLLLLVSAFVKGDWRKIYDYALAHDFRFLSYGDSSLLIP